jgi:hypothetical protein
MAQAGSAAPRAALVVRAPRGRLWDESCLSVTGRTMRCEGKVFSRSRRAWKVVDED